jgi:5-methylcytosine-specific restriction protein A
MRREFSTKVRQAAYDRSKGRCEECGTKFAGRTPEYDHVLSNFLGGEPTLQNCAVLCNPCHRRKTDTEDAPRHAKTRHQFNSNAGIKQSSRPILRLKTIRLGAQNERKLGAADMNASDEAKRLVDETGWLIETARQTYWDGRAVGREAYFTATPWDACRFARFEDAEIVRCWLLDCIGAPKLRSVEHRFIHADLEARAAQGGKLP